MVARKIRYLLDVKKLGSKSLGLLAIPNRYALLNVVEQPRRYSGSTPRSQLFGYQVKTKSEPNES